MNASATFIRRPERAAAIANVIVLGQADASAERLRLPLFLSRISAGFPSPADDYVEGKLSLDEHFIPRPEATFFLRVMLMGLADPHTAQFDLFSRSSEHADGPSEHLMQTLDQINAKMGRGTLRLAAEGHRQAWKVRSDYPSPRYTTRWADLPIAYAK